MAHDTRTAPHPDREPRDVDGSPTRSRHQHGQALVEFALILPVFFLMVAGMFDFGLGLYSDLTVINAAREGARLGVIDPGNVTAIESRVSAMSTNLDGDRLSVSIACERPDGSGFTSCATPMWQPGDATVVRVDYQYSMLFPLLFGTQIPLVSEVRMRVE